MTSKKENDRINFMFGQHPDLDMNRKLAIRNLEKAGLQASAISQQVGGSHYNKYKIQPVEYAMANGLNYCAANAVKYVTRYKDKGGIEDLRKAIHNLEILIELEEKGELS